jgi:FtsH-binding integral membrane protein
MSYAQNYETYGGFAADAAVDERVAFIRRTYLHLLGAILSFVGLTAVFLSTPAICNPLMGLLMGNWWLALIAFMVVSWVARSWAHTAISPAKQYAGLFLYTLMQAIIFVPILMVASTMGENIIPQAGMLTATIFCGLSAVVMLTKADFSFLRNFLWLGGIGAMGFVFASMIWGFSLGIVFVSAMIVLLSGYILYDTSNVVHHYRTDQHVGASLELFASVAMLFWYVLRLVMILQGRD